MIIRVDDAAGRYRTHAGDLRVTLILRPGYGCSTMARAGEVERCGLWRAVARLTARAVKMEAKR